MTNVKTFLAAAALTIGCAGAANAASFVKFDGIDGEAKAAEWGGGNTLWLTMNEDPQAIGLLLPAVQKVRAAAPRRSNTGGGPRVRVFDGFEYTDTRTGMSYVLHDAKASPAGGKRVRIDYRCKDWRNNRTGAQGSDCVQARAMRSSKGGNVETTWKVEEGEK
ncbi:MAG: hypothetical protein AAFW68_10790 [Pseudomonadota bacterium]